MVVLSCAAAFAQQPRIDGISPSEGPIAGGTLITIKGANFNGAAVTLDHVGITPIAQTDSELRLMLPQHDNGYGVIRIGTAAVEFLYLPPRLEDLPPGYITTVAGIGNYLRLDMPANTANISAWGLAYAPDGSTYFINAGNLVLAIDASGILRHVAGQLTAGDPFFLGDGGRATDAFICFPRSVARDAAGNLYVNDTCRARIRKIDPNGIITTVAGTGKVGFSGDGGPATAADLAQPTHLTCTPDGTIYFLDGNVRVRMITPDGTISTIAGNGTVGESGDSGPATAASLRVGYDDWGEVAVDADRNVFILETEGQRVRRIDAKSGLITTFVAHDPLGHALGKALGLSVDVSGNVYYSTSTLIVKCARDGTAVQWWGGGTAALTEDGAPAAQASLGVVQSLAIEPNGDVLFSDGRTGRIRRIRPSTGLLDSIAGIGPKRIGIPGRAVGASLGNVGGDIAFLPSGELIYVDGAIGRIVAVDRSGMIRDFAGNGLGTQIEGAAADAMRPATALDVDRAGNIYFCDQDKVRMLDRKGMIHRVAGLPPASINCGVSGDGGPAREAKLCQPWDVSLDSAGNLFIADTNNNRIRRIDAQTSTITTVAGSGPANGFERYGANGSFCGDGGLATAACLNTPYAVVVRDDGTMFINDYTYNRRVRKVSPNGIISSLDWPETMKLVIGPGQSVFSNAGLKIYRADDNGYRIIAGKGMFGFSGDGGPATEATFRPGGAGGGTGVAIDTDGNLFIQDGGNYRVRAIRYGGVLPPPGATIQASAEGSVIRATVFDSAGHTAPGVRVDFHVPSSGPSCALSSSFAVTDAAGLAAVSCASNCIKGSFALRAQPLTGSSIATVTMNNGECPQRRRGVRH